ncbi:MAG: hypothetical protein FGM23_02250, partial [Alphaproteobacteria bacterium]|nr:hypothetical protein [Alphaproteobacteria bacterium]
MVLGAGARYLASNGKTKVIQGEETPEQKRWWEENGDKPIDRPPTPAEELYLELCLNGFHLEKALKSCRLTGKKAVQTQQVLGTLDANSVVEQVTRLSLPEQRLYLERCLNDIHPLESFGLTDAQKLEAQRALNILDKKGNLQNVNNDGVVIELTRPSFVATDLRQADLEEADLRGAVLWGADLRGSNLQGAKLQGA